MANLSDIITQSAYAGLAENETITGLWDFTHVSGFKTDTISESGVASGVTVDGVLLKDGNITGTLLTAAQTNITSLGTLTALQVDNLNIDGNTISSTTGAVNITPLAGQAIVLDGTISVDAGVVTGATSISSTNFTGTLQTAAQTNITSLGTLTALQVDNLNINGNTISSTTGAVNITPLAGQAIVLDGTISIDAGVVTGATSISSTNFTGTLQTAAQTNITSLGTLTALQVDNLNINGNTISSTTGALNITPLAGQAIVLDGTINIDAGVVTGATSISSTTFVGALTGNASTATTAGTVTTAAQPNITSLGTLTTLTVDNITVNGAVITSDTGAISFSNENLTTTGSVQSNSVISITDQAVNANYFRSTKSTGSQGSVLYCMSGRGTEATPANVVAGDLIGRVAFVPYAGSTWGWSSTEIHSYATVATGNGEPTLTLKTGTSGKMSLFADGHLEVYGANGDVSEGWSSTVEEETLVLRDNGSVGLMLVHAAGNEYGVIGFSDTGAANRHYAYIAAYSPTNSYIPGGMEVVCDTGSVFKLNPPTRFTGGLFIEQKSAAVADIASHGQLWVKNDTPNTLWFTDAAGNDHQISQTTGSWTPKLQDASASDAEGQTYGTRSGYWRRVGNMMFITCDLTMTSVGSLSGSINIPGLPVACSGAIGSLSVVVGTGLAITAGHKVTAYIGNGSSVITLTIWSQTTGSTDMTAAQMSDDGRLILSGWYPVA